MPKLLRCLALITCFFLCGNSGSAQAAVFNPVTATLANGLQIIIVPNHLAPVVHQMVWYKVGSSDEVLGKTGLAHYLEHLMFRGTKLVPDGAFSDQVAAWGGRENAFTSYDYTAYFITASSDKLAEMMKLEADRMQNLAIQAELATPELQVVMNERQQRTDNSPEGRFAEKFRSTLLPDHPYGRPVIGWKNDIGALSVADATTFYQHHYAPNNAVVVISGDVDPVDVIGKATAIYGVVPKRDVPQRATLLAAPQPAERRFTMLDAGIEQPHLLWQAVTPSRGTGSVAESYALEVLAEALNGQTGQLYRRLVVGAAVAGDIDVSYDADARGAGLFAIGLSPQPDKSTDDLEQTLLKTLRDLSYSGLGTSEIKAAQHRLIRAADFARDSLMIPGYAFGMALTTGQSVADVEAWPERIKSVTVADVNQALRRLVANKHQVTGVLLPDPKATEAERKAAQSKIPSGKEIR